MTRTQTIVMIAKAARAFADGIMGVILPLFLIGMNFSPTEIGIFVTLTLLGSAIATLSVGPLSMHISEKALLLIVSALMALTGIGMGLSSAMIPIFLIGLIGTFNPSGGDVTPFLPLDHALLASADRQHDRTKLFANYAVIGAFGSAIGALAASSITDGLSFLEISPDFTARGSFLFYGMVGAVVLALYRQLPESADTGRTSPVNMGVTSRRQIYLLAVLFSLDSFGGGFLIQTFLVVWLHQTFALSVSATGAIFFATGLLGGASQFAAAWLSRHIGLVNTMVFTHIPAGLCAIALPFSPSLEVALALLFLRASLQQMDVPVRSSLVMSLVRPNERAAAAGITNVPRSLAAAASPALAGWLFTASPFAWPFVIGGLIKIAYDLALLAQVSEPKTISPEK